uniref:Oleosin n=1 Tax=Arundo donax TaxID=35708 RepID=A0A0A9A8C6_ARUDO
MLLLSGLALTGTVLALIVATPLLVIFSPVLVPAGITVALLTAGFVSSGGFGAAAVGVLAWMYRYLQQQPPHGGHGHGDEQPSNKAHDVKEWAQHRLDQARAH